MLAGANRKSTLRARAQLVSTQTAVPAGRVRRLASLVALAGLLGACGGTGSNASYTPASTRSALEKAGWTVRPGRGMTPLAGGRQLGWLDTISPSGARVSLQLLESSNHATAELAAIHRGVDGVRPDPTFAGVTIANVLAFTTPNGRTPIPKALVTRLASLLKTTKHATGAD